MNDSEEPLLESQQSQVSDERSLGWKPVLSGRTWFVLYGTIGASMLLTMIVLVSVGAPNSGHVALSLRATAKDLHAGLLRDPEFRRDFENDVKTGILQTTSESTVVASLNYTELSKSDSVGVLVGMNLSFPSATDSEVVEMASALASRDIDALGFFGRNLLDKYGNISIDPTTVQTFLSDNSGGDPYWMPTQTVTPTPTSSSVPTVVPTGTPGPIPTQTPTPEPTPYRRCPFHFVVRWNLFVGPYNETHWFNTTMPSVQHILAGYLGGDETDRFCCVQIKFTKKKLPGCPNYIGLSKKRHRQGTLKAKFEGVFDTHVEGDRFGSWLESQGRAQIYDNLRQDEYICGNEVGKKHTARWERRCIASDVPGCAAADADTACECVRAPRQGTPQSGTGRATGGFVQDP